MSYTALTDGTDNTTGSLRWAITRFLGGNWDSTDKTTYGATMNDWDTSAVTDMSSLFSGKSNFDENISNWDTSNVTTMEEMFIGASAFNQPLEQWNVGNVTNMEDMFSGSGMSSGNKPPRFR